ncbi:Ribosomal RNA-processing protein 15 like [Verticillium longisporum]|uniref:Ribosomal RNA-processing protein 15 like n=1 Tax=Verticillium longisporum TaxID=100787 RepID=A0A8I3AUP5_VERLO|nr:Ribosomal RNA-processing protein 15 like [Verticillium longisporum]KAG7134876.1 Ribosomal RNA-processing protein 15 like [Verticillium longisporum]
MAGTTGRKRAREGKVKPPQPTKKQKRQNLRHYDRVANDSEEEGAGAGDFKAVNLLDSDSDDIHNAAADDGAESAGSISSGDEAPKAPPKKVKKAAKAAKPTKRSAAAAAAEAQKQTSGSEADDNEDDDAQSASGSEDDDDDDDDDTEDSVSDNEGNLDAPRRDTKSRRNDPTAFSTSISKILSTKLPSSRRADPVLARSASAHENAKQAADAALEHKARRLVRLQKREAMEKGRVKDVLIATNADKAGDAAAEAASSTGSVLEFERRQRKVAQRGVVKLFNAVRAAQVKASEADRAAKKDGVVAHSQKVAKVTELSQKGFLDHLVAAGSGMKKGGAH